MRKYKRSVSIILLVTFLFCGAFKPPKRVEAIDGATLTALLGGATYTGSSLVGLGTAVGVLGVAGLVIAGGVGVWYLGDKLYKQWQTDKILNQDGSVTVSQDMVESTQRFIDNYNPSVAESITAQVGYVPMPVAESIVKNAGGVATTVFHNSIIMTRHMPTRYYDETTKHDSPIKIELTVNANARTNYKYVAIGGGMVGYSSERLMPYSTEMIGKTVTVEMKNIYSYVSYGQVHCFFQEVYTYPSGSKVTNNMDVVFPFDATTMENVGSIMIGVQSISGYPLRGLEYDSGSISLDPPVINTGSISAQKVIDMYGEDKIITAPSEWGQTVPLDTTKVFNPEIVLPTEIPVVREVDDPITYPNEGTDNPTVPGEAPSIWEWLKNLLVSILNGILAIPGAIVQFLLDILNAIKAIPGLIIDGFTALFVPTVNIGTLINAPPENSIGGLLSLMFAPFLAIEDKGFTPIIFNIGGMELVFDPTDNQMWQFFYPIMQGTTSIFILYELFDFYRKKFNVVRVVD